MLFVYFSFEQDIDVRELVSEQVTTRCRTRCRVVERCRRRRDSVAENSSIKGRGEKVS